MSGLTGSPLLRPAELLASLTGDFYFRAFNGLVTLPVAGYDYDGNWTISTGGTHTRWTAGSLGHSPEHPLLVVTVLSAHTARHGFQATIVRTPWIAVVMPTRSRAGAGCGTRYLHRSARCSAVVSRHVV